MKRLKNPKKVLFYNTLAIADVGVYDDLKAKGSNPTLGYATLVFKKEGVNLVNKDVVDTTPTDATFNTGVKVTTAYTDDGLYQSCLLKMNAPAGAEDIYYDYGLTIRKKVKHPGVNTFHNNTYQKTYGGTLDAVTTSGGYVVDATKLIMEDNLLDMITNDTSMHSNNTDITTNFAGAIVEARRCYLVDTVAYGGTETITLYDEDGVAISGAVVTIATDIGTFINEFNTDAQVTPYALAVAASTTSFYVIFITAGYKGRIAVANETIAIDSRYIHLVTKDTEVQFDVEFQMPTFFTKYNFGVLRLTWVHNHNTYWHINSGAEETIAMGAAKTNMVTNINAATFDGGAAGAMIYGALTTGAGGFGDFVLKADVDTIGWRQASVANATGVRTNGFTAATTNYLYSTPMGKFPSLTSDDVQRAIWNLRDAGMLPGMYSNSATDGTAYAKYHILCDTTVNDDTGVSTSDTFQQEVVIYAGKTVAGTTTTFEIGTYAGIAATCTFEALLGSWHGVSQVYWLPDVAVIT